MERGRQRGENGALRVEEASTSYAKALTSVTYDPSRASDEAILAAIKRAGFEATPA